MFAVVNEPEVVTSGGTFLKVGGENILLEDTLLDSRVEEGGLWSGFDWT